VAGDFLVNIIAYNLIRIPKFIRVHGGVCPGDALPNRKGTEIAANPKGIRASPFDVERRESLHFLALSQTA
jgi:hypothetical protein